jgi:RNA polymerase sigma-70 factor (ECF subfamily)
MLDRDARFRAIYDAHSRLVYNFLARFLRDQEEAGDAMVETFKRAYRGLDGYRGECSERAWLMKIATNVGRRSLQAGRRHDHLSLDCIEGGKDGAEPCAPSTTESLVLNALEAERYLAMLDPTPRAAVWMRVGLQMTDEDVAEALGVPVGTVKSWVWRSLAKLRKACETES